MLLTCPRCRTQFSAPDSAFADGPLTVRCGLCKYTWRHPGQHPEGGSNPGEKPILSTGAASSVSPPAAPAGRETQSSQAKTSPPSPTTRPPASATTQGAPIPEFKNPEFKKAEYRAADTYKTFTNQKPGVPEFKAPSAETAGAQPIDPQTKSKVPEQQPAQVSQASIQEIQTETPVAPAAMLSATTDGFSAADRSFFETDSAESDKQTPVVTMGEVRQPTTGERQINDVYSTQPRKQSSYWGALAACLLIFAALVFAVWFWLGLPQSRQVSSDRPANPVAERTLEFRLPSFGLGKSIEGLEFYDVVAAYRVENGESQLIVEGEVRNTSAETKTLSPMRAVLFDDGGQPIADWIFDGGKPVLEIGENLRFHTVLNGPPTAAVNYEVAFTDAQPK